jgi:prepilin-type N-terminal cleavage/methylation domain-containing protein
MKTEFKTKFLQHLIEKREDKGFTLIELLVVIIIIGILSAIALPSFLNQANKAKQSEAKTYVGSMNRAQQAFYLERNGFTSTIGSLGLGIPTQTENYLYGISASAAAITETTGVTNFAEPQSAALLPYVGAVNLGEDAQTSEATTLAILCESTTAGPGVALASYATSGPVCPADWEQL